MSQLVLAADALAGSPVAGTTEYNGTIQTFTPLGTQRGVVPSEQFFKLNAGLAGSDAASVQSIFGVGVTLSASTQYEFELVFALSRSAGTTSHNIVIGFGGTATLNNIGFLIQGSTVSGTANLINNMGILQVGAGFSTSATTTAITACVTASVGFLYVIKGTVSINAGGTFIPQYTLSAAPGGAYTTQAGSYMKIKPIGVSGANVSVGTWA